MRNKKKPTREQIDALRIALGHLRSGVNLKQKTDVKRAFELLDPLDIEGTKFPADMVESYEYFAPLALTVLSDPNNVTPWAAMAAKTVRRQAISHKTSVYHLNQF